MRHNSIISNTALSFTPFHSTSHRPLSFSLILMWVCFIFFLSGACSTPCVPALWMPPGKWAPRLSFPNCAFCTFNHVTLSQADYRRLSSLEKVRAGIRASWGIRNPNWFQLSLPSNDQFFSHIDGALARMLGEGSKAFFFLPSTVFFGTSKRLHAGQLQRDLKPHFNINHMGVPLELGPCYVFRFIKVNERKSEWKEVATEVKRKI